MADILAPKQRSALMARIRSAGNASTELRLVAVLRASRITGWRRGCRLRLRGQTTDDGRRITEAGRRLKHRATVRHPCSSAKSAVKACCPSSAVGRPPSSIRHRLLLVRPDFVFRSERLVVFVDGCFWHGCPAHYTRPKARRVFWDAKIAANRARDRRVDRALRMAGWRVLHLWEHALEARQLGRTLARVRRAIGSACGLRRRVPRTARCGTRRAAGVGAR
jgi:DNA mismatch endonuclease (patch repair protein)